MGGRFRYGARDRGLAVTIQNFYEGGGDVAIDIGANLFPDVGKFTDGEGTIDFDDIASTKEGDQAALASAEVAKSKQPEVSLSSR